MRILASAAAVALLAACAADTGDAPGTETAATAPAAATAASPASPPAGADPSFSDALTEAYGAMAQFESRAGTAEDAAYFRSRRDAVVAGAPPVPEPAPDQNLQLARQDLVAALNLREVMPVEVATAQAAYDCWANDARAAAEPVPIDCPRLFRDTIQQIADARGG